MPWQCKLLPEEETTGAIGEMWFSSHARTSIPGSLSPQYRRDWADKRDPLFVMTPGGIWCVDRCSVRKGVWSGNGWTVIGVAPNITGSPSINIEGEYHGWLQNGVLSDDLEGRKYEVSNHAT